MPGRRRTSGTITQEQPRPRLNLGVRVLLEDSVRSATIKKLFSLRTTLKMSGDVGSVAGKLKRMNLLDASAEVNYRIVHDLLSSAIAEILEAVNMRTQFDEPGDAPFVQIPGQVVISTKLCEFQIHDPDGELEKNPAMKEALETIKKTFPSFRTCGERYRAHAEIKGELLSITIDQGQHKERIAGFFPLDQNTPLLYYKHFEHGNGQYSDNRILYVQDVLRRVLGDYPTTVPHGFQGSDVYGLGTLNGQKQLNDLMRLSRSVKDLDLFLRNEQSASFAAKLFEDGVTNMLTFITYLGYAIPNKDRDRLSVLNETEDALLRDMLRTHVPKLKQLRETRDDIKTSLAVLRGAKQLNFEITKELTDFQLLLVNLENPADARAKELRSRFPKLREKMIAFAEICDKIVPKQLFNEDPTLRYSKKAAEVMGTFQDKFDMVISGGNFLTCSDIATLSKMLCASNRKDLDTFKLENIKTAEDLVRFLHFRLVQYSTGGWFLSTKSGLGGFRSYAMELSVVNMIDTTISRINCLNVSDRRMNELEIYAILKKTNDAVSPLKKTRSGDMGAAVIGDDFADISIQLGKHYAELRVTTDDINGLYIVKLFYVDTNYHGAPGRKIYIQKVLSSFDFKMHLEGTSGHQLYAELRTENKEKWKEAYAETMRLLFSASDLDLFFDGDSSGTDYAASIFKKGATNIANVFNATVEIRKGSDNGAVSKYLEIIRDRIDGLDLYRKGDFMIITEAFCEKYGFAPSEIVPLVKDFKSDELEQMIDALFNLEEAAKKAGDKPRLGQLLRLEKKLEAIVVGKELGKENPE